MTGMNVLEANAKVAYTYSTHKKALSSDVCLLKTQQIRLDYLFCLNN